MTRPSDAGLGKYARAEMLLRQHVWNGVRPVDRTVRRLQAAIDDLPFPESEFARVTSDSGLAFEELQLARMTMLNRVLHLGFTRAQLAEATDAAPVITADVSLAEVPILCWRLDDVTGTVRSYYLAQRILHVSREVQLSTGEGEFSGSPYLFDTHDTSWGESRFWSVKMPISDVETGEPGLWWDVLNLAASPDDDTKREAFAYGTSYAMLAATCMHSDFVKGMKGLRLDVPRLRFNVDERSYRHGLNRYGLTLQWCRERHLHWYFAPEEGGDVPEMCRCKVL